MSISSLSFLPGGNLGTAAALFSAKSGLSVLSRRWRPAPVCVLTFHGMRDGTVDQPDLLDVGQHVTVDFFDQICEHLAKHYQVVSTLDVVAAQRGGLPLQEKAVAITFDDGYASNYHLAFPVLKRLGLPATIFLTTGYLDGAVLPWFVRLELALARTQQKRLAWASFDLVLGSREQRCRAYGQLCAHVKKQPQVAMAHSLEAIEAALGVQVRPGDPLPAALQPMTWDMAREMQASGVIELGGHTHTHPVLGRCEPELEAREIQTCAARMKAELGVPPRVFAYPNGMDGDFDVDTQRLLAESGFEAAFTMHAGFVHPHHEVMALPRYGSPESTLLHEAMVSGCMERLRQARLGRRGKVASTSVEIMRPQIRLKPKPLSKVLHFITGIGGGGAENFLRSLVANMQGSRWQTVIVVVRVHPHEAFAEELRAMGCIIHDLDATALLKPGVWLAVRRIIAQERPDVVQTWMHHADFIGGLAAYAAGAHGVVWGVRATEVHRNPGDSALKTFLFHQALRWSAKLLPKRIIANSTVAMAVHEAMGYPRSKMVWVPNGVNAQRFAPNAAAKAETRAQLDIPAQALVVGFVGRFHPVKDLTCFFKAAALVQAQRAEVHCVLVGGREDELYPAAKAAYEQLPYRDQVHFVSFGSATERYYPAFDVFTLCSSSEAFPNVVLEAMATGVPCVTTNAGDCATMLKNLGEVVPCGDATALASGWLKMLALSVDERAELAERSRARALADYSMERAARQFMDVYEEVAT